MANLMETTIGAQKDAKVRARDKNVSGLPAIKIQNFK
jgi:hypothetical protein